MSKNKATSKQVARAAPSSLVQGLISAPTHERVEGHAVPIAPFDSDGVNARFGLEIAKAPIPQRRYAADSCMIVYRDNEARFVFFQKSLVGDGIDSALVVRFNPIAVLQFILAMDCMESPTVSEIAKMMGLPEEDLHMVETEPTQKAFVMANLVAVAVAGHETCLDFYHASAFAMRKSTGKTTLDVEPVVRVDIRTSLFVAMVKKVKEIASEIPSPLAQGA